MENESIQQIITVVKELSMPGAVVVVFIVLYKAGILGAIASWMKKSPTEAPQGGLLDRIGVLEDFKLGAETNHFHDLDELKNDRRAIWNAIENLRRDFNAYQLSMESRISRLETKIFNGHLKK